MNLNEAMQAAMAARITNSMTSPQEKLMHSAFYADIHTESIEKKINLLEKMHKARLAAIEAGPGTDAEKNARSKDINKEHDARVSTLQNQLTAELS